MSSSPAGGSRARVLGLVIGLVALVSAFALASFASGAADTLKGGSSQLSLKQKGLKFASKKPKLTITGGAVDPTTMTGNTTVTGKTTAKGKKGKAKLKFTALNLTGGGAGSIDAKVGSKKVTSCMTFSKGTLARNGFDGLLANAKLKLGKKCAKQIKKKAGAGKKGAVGNVVSVDTSPSTITVTGGTANLVFDTIALQHLSAHGVLPNGAAADQSNNGVTAIAPATLDIPSHTFTFPVTGGSIAPDGSNGQVKVGGGILLKKVNTSCVTGGGVTGNPCNPFPPSASPCYASQNEIAITDLVFDASSKVVSATAQITVPAAPSNNQTLSNAPLSTITAFSGSMNPSTKSGAFSATLVNTLAGAGAENSVFGSSLTPGTQGGPCNDAANDFAPNASNGAADPIGVSALNPIGQ